MRRLKQKRKFSRRIKRSDIFAVTLLQFYRLFQTKQAEADRFGANVLLSYRLYTLTTEIASRTQVKRHKNFCAETLKLFYRIIEPRIIFPLASVCAIRFLYCERPTHTAWRIGRKEQKLSARVRIEKAAVNRQTKSIEIFALYKYLPRLTVASTYVRQSVLSNFNIPSPTSFASLLSPKYP